MADAQLVPMADSQSFLKDRLVFYLDLLGFKEAALADDTRLGVIGDLLRQFAARQTPYSHQSYPQEGGGTHHEFTPEVTTFSDHVVFSYPLDELATLGGKDGAILAGLAIGVNLVNFFALAALNVDLLLRGGVAAGRMYHAEGVAFGPALVAAYLMESVVAEYPRVAADRSILRVGNVQAFIEKDYDGVHFFNHLLHAGPLISGIGEGAIERQIDFWRSTSARAREHALSLEAQDKWREASKWTWFLKYSEVEGNRSQNIVELAKK